MVLSVYYVFNTAPVRAIFLVTKQLSVDINMIQQPSPQSHKGASDSLKSYLLRVNAHTTPPTFYDSSTGLALWEPNAILIYLVMKYGPENSNMYPEDPGIRAKVDEMLYFSCRLLDSVNKIWIARVFNNETPSKEALKAVEDMLGRVELDLEGAKKLCCDFVTLADIVIFAILTDFMVFETSDMIGLGNIRRWFIECKRDIVDAQENFKGAADCIELFEQIKKCKN